MVVSPSRYVAAASRELPAAVLDPDGAVVVLSEERWSHIVDGHPELADQLDEVLATVESPTRRLPGRDAAEQWFYLEGADPSRWIKVVVRYETSDSGRIVTAFPRRSIP